MDFLDQSVLPQSSSHILLLKYLLGLTYILFLPYVSVLFVTLVYSLYFSRKAHKTGDGIYRDFSKEMIDIITYNKGIAFALGILPLTCFVFGYSQIFHLTGSNVPFLLIITLSLLTIALFLIYTYKYTFHLKDIFNYANEKKAQEKSGSRFPEEITEYNKQTNRLFNKSGRYGLIILIAATYIFTGTMQLASDPSRWDNDGSFLGMIFSLTTFLNYLQFITASFAITSAVILYSFSRNDKQENFIDKTHKTYLRGFVIRTGLIATIILPALIITNVMTRPVLSLSFNYFITVLFVMLLLISISSLFYFMIKESSYKYSTILIVLFIILFALLAIQDQFAIDTSSNKQSAILAAGYDAYELKINEEMGIDTKPISGEDIYNGRCIACHRFDIKVVGPPYNQTLPKYEGKKDDLVAFILNPVKKNPDYPAMPNQGLKPKEAEAIADYLLNTYKKSNN